MAHIIPIFLCITIICIACWRDFLRDDVIMRLARDIMNNTDSDAPGILSVHDVKRREKIMREA